MSTRNLIWLAVIVVAATVGWVAGGWVWALGAAVVVLVVSEIVERRRRHANAGRSPLRGAIASRRGKR